MAKKAVTDDKSIEEARLIGKHATNEGAEAEAPGESIQRRKHIEILDMFHSTDYDADYDYKKQRKKP